MLAPVASTRRQLAVLPPVLGLYFDAEREPLKRGSADLKPYLAPHRVQREAGDSEDNDDDDPGKHDGTLLQPPARAHAMTPLAPADDHAPVSGTM